MTNGEKILALASHDPQILRDLARRLTIHASAHMLCGHPEDQGIIPDTAMAGVVIEALADLLEEPEKEKGGTS